MFPLIKILLLSLTTIVTHFAIKPPHPPATKDDRVIPRTLFDKIPRKMAFTVQTSINACVMAECTTLLALYFRSSLILSNICPASFPSLSNISILTPTFLLGIGLVCSFGMLRIWSMSTLGTLFTYEISVSRDHKLITSGPYAYVRHPSYTGVILFLFGILVICLCPGSYIDECGIMSSSAKWVVFLWVGFLVYVAASLLGRAKLEDEGLRKEFGESWERYSRVVPCRFIPGLV